MDILPTVRNYLDIESKELESGINLMPLIHEKNRDFKNRYIFSHLITRDNKGPRVIYRAAVYQDWKYVFYELFQKSEIFRKELYNLKDDPKEALNIIKENKSIAHQLFYRFIDFEKKCKKFMQETKKVKLTDKEEQELKTLGYVE